MDLDVDKAARDHASRRSTAAPASALLQVRSVSKTYGPRGGTTPVLADINLDIPFGQILGVVGPTGCGKTTLLDIICGLKEPDAGGSVLLDDVDVTGKRGVFAYMPQRDALLPWRTALDNAILGLTVRGVPKREAAARANELFHTFALEAYRDYHPQDLSGGMRQRIALLRTFLFPSDYMLLDEPFGALDAITRSNIHLWLLSALRGLERTVVMITHDINEAIFLADRVVVLGTSPGHVALDREVLIPRPRDLGVEHTDAFQDIRAQTIETLSAFVPDFTLGRNAQERRG